MPKIIYIICVLFLVNYSFSQEEKKPLKTGWNISHKTILTNNQSALFVINGIILDKIVMEKIPISNIESLEVLKDEKATSSYGKLGENGVILIQTKEISEVDLKNLYKLYPITFDLNLKQKVKIISGEITDCENVPLSNVLVQNLNTKKSTFTDSLGKYTIDVRKNDILCYTNQNYQSQRIQFIKQKKIIVSLKMIPRNDKIMLKKPVIYLYPTKKTEIELSINFDGKMLTTFPKLEKSWEVTAYENGQIFDKKTNRFYNSLFWDGEISFPVSHYQYKTGFVVEREKLTSFLIEKLELMGLNTTETNDFVQYWLPILEKNKYTFIHFLVNEEYTVFSTNNVNPKPDTSIRIFMEFTGVDEPISIAPQQLPSTERNGFTLVEWGGSDVSNMKPFDYLMIN
jgi:TonB-dependent SusC/RagA subfamily outer membrane receptor